VIVLIYFVEFLNGAKEALTSSSTVHLIIIINYARFFNDIHFTLAGRDKIMAEPLRILILEDNPADAELIQFELQDAGFIFTPKVVMAKEDFIRELQEFSPDLILSDYDLPKYNGALALAEARRRRPDTPFILVTGAVTEDRAIEILTQGAKDYVLKSRLQQRLAPAVQRALEEAAEHRARKKAEKDLREAHRTLERQVIEQTEALRKAEGLYHSLFDNMLEGFAYCRMIFDQGHPIDFIYLDVNKSFESLTGLKNVVGKRVSEVIPGIQESDKELFEAYGRVALTGKPERFELYVSALQMWFSISVYSPGKGFFTAVFDIITERKKAEEVLRESEKKFATAFLKNSVPAAITTVKEGRYIEVSEAFLNIMGMKRSEIIGKTSTGIGFITPEQRTIFLNEYSQKGSVINLELQVRTKGEGKRYGLFNSVMISLSGENHLLTMVTDITDLKQVEKERERMISELQIALSDVKKLSGLLPICASCKKIRDDKGYWKQVEAYVSEHSEAQFSHGICPGCMKDLYPDLYPDL
jgi:PAS domain S-box-containing protein